MHSVTWECPIALALTFNFDAAKGALKEAVLEPIVLSSITLNAFFPLSVDGETFPLVADFAFRLLANC